MDLNTSISFAQLLVGLLSLLGVGGVATAGWYFAKRSSQKQVQKVGDNSSAIQSGRDTKIR